MNDGFVGDPLKIVLPMAGMMLACIVPMLIAFWMLPIPKHKEDKSDE